MMYFTARKQWVKVEEHFQAMTGEKADAVARARRGEMLVAQDKCEEAVEAFDSALQIEPALAVAHQGLVECFRQAVQSEPDYSKAQAGLGLLLVAKREFAGAIPHLLAAGDVHGQDQARVSHAVGTAYGPASLVQQLARR